MQGVWITIFEKTTNVEKFGPESQVGGGNGGGEGSWGGHMYGATGNHLKGMLWSHAAALSWNYPLADSKGK